jgi:hypothetical protein
VGLSADCLAPDSGRRILKRRGPSGGSRQRDLEHFLKRLDPYKPHPVFDFRRQFRQIRLVACSQDERLDPVAPRGERFFTHSPYFPYVVSGFSWTLRGTCRLHRDLTGHTRGYFSGDRADLALETTDSGFARVIGNKPSE